MGPECIPALLCFFLCTFSWEQWVSLIHQCVHYLHFNVILQLSIQKVQGNGLLEFGVLWNGNISQMGHHFKFRQEKTNSDINKTKNAYSNISAEIWVQTHLINKTRRFTHPVCLKKFFVCIGAGLLQLE